MKGTHQPSRTKRSRRTRTGQTVLKRRRSEPRGPDPRRTARPNLLLAVCSIALAVAPLVFLRHYQTTYDYDRAIIVFGWLLVACFLVVSCTAILLLATLSSSPRDAFWSGLFTAFFTLSSVFIGLIYLSAYISNSTWGDTIAYDIAATFAREPGALLDLLPFATRSKVTLVALMFAAATLLTSGSFLLYRFLANQLFLAVTRWLRRGPSSGTSRRRLLAGFGSLSLAIASLATAATLLIQRSPSRLVGEPISSFLKWFPAADTLQLDNYRLQAALEDRNARATYPKPAEFSKKNVVLILADSLRADHMGVYDYERDTTPFLSALLRRGVLHRTDMALSTCSESYCGIASTFASRPFHQVSDKSLKISSLLRDLGYRINFFISGDHRAWKYVHEFYGNDVDLFYDHVVDDRFDIDDDRKLLAGLEQVAPFSGQPNFFYFFLMSSHVSGTRYPEFERYRPAKFDGILSFWNEVGGTQRIAGKISARQDLEPQELTIFSNHHDNGVLQADAMIASVLTMLEEKGYLNDSIVVILSDHGDGLGEHGHLGHTRYLNQEDIHIPLLILDPDTSVYRNHGFATQMDVAPTIIDRLGLPIPASWQGRSLLRPPEDRVTLHQTRRGANPCRAVVSSLGDSLFKYIRCGAPQNGQKEELYDLNADPREQKNLIDTAQPELAARLRREIDSRFTLTTNKCDSFECVD